MAAKNDITGDSIKTKVGEQNKYADGWERIFGSKPVKEEEKPSKESENDKQNPDK